MFTGIVEEMGTVKAIRQGPHSAVVEIQAQVVLEDLHIGDSIAVNGVCLTATAFSPAASTTRGMLMTVLARQAGVDTSTGSTWYEAGMTWAVDEGLSDGSNPNGSITRQELAVMLYRSAGAQPGTADLSGYADGDSVASWAADAVRWAVDEGILSGKSGNRLDPAGTASRAEVAVTMTQMARVMGR